MDSESKFEPSEAIINMIITSVKASHELYSKTDCARVATVWNNPENIKKIELQVERNIMENLQL